MDVLVTGGAGYIGSHVTLALLEAGYRVVAIDNLSNSSAEAISRVQELAGTDVVFVEGDVRDLGLLNSIFSRYNIQGVLHFAGLKSVGESAHQPLDYYDNNVVGTLRLCEVMSSHGINKLVFSSSATVYGAEHSMPLSEQLPTGRPTNPYGRSKLMIEEILSDIVASDPAWQVAVLRYFNPVGAHPSGCIGENPTGIPNNLLPYVSQVAIGRRKILSIFGGDYPTRDGTGVRDYIHVLDLAEGHVKALQAIAYRPGINVWNLGTGKGYSVLEMVRAFESASGCRIPYKFEARRPGDVAECWADATKAAEELNWSAFRNLEEMMADTWNWQNINPEGYKS
jgi:UDP-glucose 4-epimerase